MEKDANQPVGSAASSFFYNLDSFTLAKDLVKNWWVILLAGATAFFIVSMLPYIHMKSTYTATSTLVVTGTIRSGSSYRVYSGNAESFVGILTDEYVLQEVAEDMGVKKLDVQVDANIISETNLISLSVSANNPTIAHRVLTGLLEHYTDISRLMMPGYVLDELVSPTYPTSPDNLYDIQKLRVEGILIAMVAVAALILLLSYSYDSIKNENDVERKLSTRRVVTIYHEKKYKTFRMRFAKKRKRKNALLITSPLASFGFVEAFRRLREKLVARCAVSGKKIILVTSMLENEGKSTVAANLALALSDVSDKVALVDADLRKPAQYKLFEKQNHKGYLSAYLNGEVSLEESVKKDNESGIYLVYDKKNHMDSSEIVSNSRMELLLNTLSEQMDYVVIDTPPMNMVADAEMLAQYADYSILVLSPDHAPAKQINDCIDQLNDCHAKLLGCVLNNLYTLRLFLGQTIDIRLPGSSSGSYGKYNAYGRGYGYGTSYGYGYGYGYGTDSSQKKAGNGSSDGQKNKSGNYRAVESGEDFFAARVEKKLEVESKWKTDGMPEVEQIPETGEVLETEMISKAEEMSEGAYE